ncbi:cell division protein FtsX [Aestuariivirga litoralis]|uniref:cell division protein FtsX n=1 Tax=Aestuariivirga litoralis TaxID=2650924 RepID=UPI0018C5DE4D|nr:hypothetical protein [Aestuariivirga litoralis]MBG1233706.1 hypothetical protein [Aestuariivirga litoralis]
MSDQPSAKPSPVFPRRVAPLRALIITMAVMCYLACLAIGALVLINRATQSWTQGLAREITVEVRPLSDAKLDDEVKKALSLLEATKGVLSTEALPLEDSARLLEPWLGKVEVDDLPLPRLIRVSIDEANPPDYEALATSLTTQVKGASLDTHQRWQNEFIRLGNSLTLLTALVLGLISLATILLVTAAARGVIEANRSIVDVLELIGAEPHFIARQNDRQFLSSGLTSGFAGLILGLLTFSALGVFGGAADEAMAAAGRSLFFAPQARWQLVAGLLSVPVAATLIALLVSRITLMRILGKDL